MDEQVRKTDVGRGRAVAEEFIPCHGIWNLTVYQGEREVGRLFIIEPPDRRDAVLLDIYIYWPEDRRKGYASDLLKYVKAKWPEVITGYRNKAGLHLCLQNGFTLTKPPVGGKSFLTYSTKKKEGRYGHQ